MKKIITERFPMLVTIALESRDLHAYARRADAWAASEAKPPTTENIIDAYAMAHAPARISRVAVRRALAHAASVRIDARARLWGSLANDIGDDE